MYALHALTLDDFKPQARALLLNNIPPAQVTWSETGALFNETPLPPASGTFTVPKAFLFLAQGVSCHADPTRFARLYELLWRLHHKEPQLLEDPADPLMRTLNIMAKQIGRDIHKTHAFVRFRKTEIDGQDTYLAWHCPDHRILTLAAPFFVKRFRNQRWGIATPDESCCWDGTTLTWGEGIPQSAAPQPDAMEDLWRTYYRNIFNPARIKIKMMKSEMPVRHWRTLPETQDIPAMLQKAEERVETMLRSAFTSSEKSLRRAAIVRKRQES